MANRAWSLYLAGTVFFLLSSAWASPAETLREAVQYLIETNPEIRTVVYNRLARDQQVTQARSGYFPELGLMAGAGFQEVDKPIDQSLDPWEFALSLRQNVFRGWQDMNEVQRQEARVRSQAFVIRSAAENTALQTSRVYLEVLRKQAFVELAKENLQIHQRIYDQIRLRSESGVDRRADMNQVESRLALAESNLIVNETNLLDAQTNYLGVVGHLPEGLVMPEPPDAFMPTSLEDAQELALQGHPTLQQAEEDLVARKHQDDVARAPFMPIVDLELDKYWSEDVEYGLNTEEENLIGMVRVRWNFFKGWKDQARKAETSYLISEAREIRNNTHRQVVESIRLSWMAYQAAMNRMSFLQKRVESSDAAAQAYARQWDIGKRTLLDVLDAEAERIDARRQLIDARFDGFIAQYRIMNGMGKMVHCLDLDWPEEAYFGGEAGTTGREKENS